jgi:8-hydroxy-5-deazaflavin:NADPH oxidoreductase
VKIGIIGRGNVGGGLAQFWQQAGHDVRTAGRDDVAEAAAHGDVVLLAVPAGAVDDALASAGSLDGTVLIDATNDMSRARESQAGHVAELAPSARVVKGFNAIFALTYDKLSGLDPPAQVVYCGDDADAKETFAQLARDAYLEPIDVGGLEQAPNVEGFARMIINLAYNQGFGPHVYRFEAP